MRVWETDEPTVLIGSLHSDGTEALPTVVIDLEPNHPPRWSRGALATQVDAAEALKTQADEIKLTTQAEQTQALTTQAEQTQALTTQALTTQALETQTLTAQALTTRALQTQALTAQALITTAIPAGPVTGTGLYHGGSHTHGADAVTAAIAVPSSARPAVSSGGQTGLPTSANVEAPIDMSGSLTGLHPVLGVNRPDPSYRGTFAADEGPDRRYRQYHFRQRHRAHRGVAGRQSGQRYLPGIARVR